MNERDKMIRSAADHSIRQMIREKGTNVLSWQEIDKGFEFQGQKIHYATKAAGIFKPKEIGDGAALSIKQVNPSRKGRSAPYSDRLLGEGVFEYQLQRDGAISGFNKLLDAAHLANTPMIFFRGIADSLYEVLYPVFIRSISFELGSACVVFDQTEENLDVENLSLSEKINTPLIAAYGEALGKTRLHQAAFRKRVLLAYGLRCALTNLPIEGLLEAAHIIKDSEGGEPSVTNGIAMTSFHHAAYDKNFMGIDADGKIHLNKHVAAVRDGPMFDYGMLRLEGTKIRLPQFEGHHPNREWLDHKFEQFRKGQIAG
jgi:putative restriction endonuclease